MPSNDSHVLMVMMDIEPEHEAAFNECYNEEHVPAMLTVPGVINATRYRMTQKKGLPFPKYVAVYQLENPGVFDSKAFWDAANSGTWPTKIRPHCKNASHVICKRIFPDDNAEIHDKHLFMAMMDIEPEHEAAFNENYNTEHVPVLTTVPGILGARRYEMTGIKGLEFPKYVAIYQVESPDVIEGEAMWKAADSGEWPTKIRPHISNVSWVICEKIYPQG